MTCSSSKEPVEFKGFAIVDSVEFQHKGFIDAINARTLLQTTSENAANNLKSSIGKETNNTNNGEETSAFHGQTGNRLISCYLSRLRPMITEPVGNLICTGISPGHRCNESIMGANCKQETLPPISNSLEAAEAPHLPTDMGAVDRTSPVLVVRESPGKARTMLSSAGRGRYARFKAVIEAESLDVREVIELAKSIDENGLRPIINEWRWQKQQTNKLQLQPSSKENSRKKLLSSCHCGI